MKTKFKLTVFFFSMTVLTLVFSRGVAASTLLLNPPFSNVKQGDDLKLDVVLNGQDEMVDGVDAVLTYDVNVLSVKSIKEGAFFAAYPAKKDDGGQIRITALAPKEGVKIFGDIVVASIDFEVLDTSQTKVDIVYEKDSTKDSNAPLHGSANDSLTSVTGGSYSVVATPERIKKAQAKKASSTNWPLIIFVILLILGAIGAWYYLKNRKKKEDVFVPEPFPLDKPPKVE